MRIRLAKFLVLVLLAVLFSGQGRGEAIPFPTRSATFKKDGLRFEVNGRVVVPRNADVISLRQGTIVGRSSAVIEVSGYLEIKCVTGGNMVLKDVWIELTPECKEVYLSSIVFEGSGGLRPSAQGPSRARIYMEATTFKPGTSLRHDSTSGKLTFSGVTSRGPFAIHGRAKDEKGSNQTELQILNMNAYGGLSVQDVRKTVVTMSMLGGKESSFVNCATLGFATNHAKSEVLRFSQSKPKNFGKTKIKNTDFYTQRVIFAAPAVKPGKAERVRFDGCWFLDADTPQSVRSRIIQDVGQDENIAVLATFKKLQKRPLGLVKYSEPKD